MLVIFHNVEGVSGPFQYRLTPFRKCAEPFSYPPPLQPKRLMLDLKFYMDHPWVNTLGAIEAIFDTPPLGRDMRGGAGVPQGVKNFKKIFFSILKFFDVPM